MGIQGAASRFVGRFLRLGAVMLALAAPVAAPGAAAARPNPLAGDSSLRVDDVAGPEYRTNGRIFGFDPARGPYSCSGTSLNTPSRSIVITAGHCVVEGGHWGRRLVFIPAYDHGARPFGSFKAAGVRTMRQWRRFGNPDFDVAAIRVEPNQLGLLGDVVGGRDWAVNQTRFGQYEIFGYPGGFQQGEALRSCRTRGRGSDRLSNRLPGPPTVPGTCDMARGASGGSWLLDGRVNGVTSYSYPLRRGRLFSPYFGAGIGNFLSQLP